LARELLTGAKADRRGIDRHVDVEALGAEKFGDRRRLHHGAFDERRVIEVLTEVEQRRGDAVAVAQSPRGGNAGPPTLATDEAGRRPIIDRCQSSIDSNLRRRLTRIAAPTTRRRYRSR
jgi:hypothetical protein